MEVRSSARKHGITEADMLHAVRHPLARLDLGDDAWMLLGPDTTGRLLEVGVGGASGDEPRIFHAMPLRPKFYRYLP